MLEIVSRGTNNSGVLYTGTFANSYGTSTGVGSLIQGLSSGHKGAAGAAQFEGVQVGVRWVDVNGNIVVKPNWVANTTAKTGEDIIVTYEKVFPEFLFHIKTSGEALVKSHVNATFDMTTNQGIDTNYGNSKETLNLSATGDQFRVVDVADIKDNDFGDTGAIALCAPVNILALSQTSI